MKNRSYKGPIFSFPLSGRHLVVGKMPKVERIFQVGKITKKLRSEKNMKLKKWYKKFDGENFRYRKNWYFKIFLHFSASLLLFSKFWFRRRLIIFVFFSQGKVAYELFFCIILKADMSRGEIAKLAAKLWSLAAKCDSADKRVAVSTKYYNFYIFLTSQKIVSWEASFYPFVSSSRFNGVKGRSILS